MFKKYLGCSFAACLLLAQAAGATTIVQSSGNSDASQPLGYFAPYVPYGLTPTVYAVEWSQTATYTGVDVTANLFTSGSPGVVDYSLVTEIGTGTTFATSGIIQGSVTTPINPADVNLFDLSSLGPGTYFLVLSSPVPDTAWQYNDPFSSASYSTASGVTFLGDEWSNGTSTDSAYGPGSSFTRATVPVEFQVTGTIVPTPEPAPLGMCLIAIGGFAIFTSRERRYRYCP
ncbi:MAG: hypothetical protein ABSD59_20060 [Terracidiphilus sp.]